METEHQVKPKKERKPPTERQAFATWTMSVLVLGMGFGIAVCGLNVLVDPNTSLGASHFLVIGALTVFVGALLIKSVPRTLKPFERFAKDKTAVSPVIAVILMVAITVVMAAVVFVLVSDIGGQNESAPNIGFTKEGDGLMVTSVDRVVSWGDLVVTGCDTVPSDNETVDAGDRVTDCDGDVLVVHRGSNTLLYLTKFGG